MFDFLKVAVKEEPKAKFSATVTLAGKTHQVSNLGPQSFTAADAGKYKQGQKVSFDLVMKDPKDTVTVRGSGAVAAVAKGEAKISLAELPEPSRQQVARFLARSMLNR
jgi:hypothetical protein